MKNKFIALTGLFLLMIFVLAGCGEKNQQQAQKQISNENSQQMNQGENKSNSTRGTLKELLSRGEKLRCEFSSENTETKMNGTAYTDGERLHQEVFVDQGDSADIKTNLIKKDDQIYLWNSMEPGQGMKINLNETEKTTGSNEGNVNSDLNQPLDYKCEPWQVNEEKFQIPADIDFKDINTLMKGQENNTQNGNGNSAMPNSAN